MLQVDVEVRSAASERRSIVLPAERLDDEAHTRRSS
jgi:hypothetical protein